MHNKILVGFFRPLPIFRKYLQAREKWYQDILIASEKAPTSSPQNCPYHPCYQELLADHFMILTENIFGNKSLFVMMNMVLIMSCRRYAMSMYYCFITHCKKFFLSTLVNRLLEINFFSLLISLPHPLLLMLLILLNLPLCHQQVPYREKPAHNSFFVLLSTK